MWGFSGMEGGLCGRGSRRVFRGEGVGVFVLRSRFSFFRAVWLVVLGMGVLGFKVFSDWWGGCVCKRNMKIFFFCKLCGVYGCVSRDFLVF